MGEDGSVAGCFAVAPHTIDRDDLPRSQGRGAPRQIPAVLLAKLAIDRRLQGQRLGSELLVVALTTIVDAARRVGGKMVVVDGIDEAAVRFYILNDATDPGAWIDRPTSWSSERTNQDGGPGRRTRSRPSVPTSGWSVRQPDDRRVGVHRSGHPYIHPDGAPSTRPHRPFTHTSRFAVVGRPRRWVVRAGGRTIEVRPNSVLSRRMLVWTTADLPARSVRTRTWRRQSEMFMCAARAADLPQHCR